MNKQEQQKQIERMMRFIDQEAAEKAEEITTKARSEISALRNQQVRKRKEELNDKYSKLAEEIKVEKKIAKSRKFSESKISIARDRDAKMNQVKDNVVERLKDVSKNKNYPDLIKHLILEGLLRVQEKKVSIQCREEDKTIVEAQIPKAVEAFHNLVQEKAGVEFKVTVTLSEERLDGPPREGYKGCCGGVVLIARNGRIVLRNTLDARLDIAFKQLKPSLRALCFGVNFLKCIHHLHYLITVIYIYSYLINVCEPYTHRLDALYDLFHRNVRNLRAHSQNDKSSVSLNLL